MQGTLYTKKIRFFDCTDIEFLVARVIRVIRQPRGNMLLIGIGGSGRQSLSRLAAYVCEYTTFQIEVTRHYRKQEFRDGKICITVFVSSYWPGLGFLMSLPPCLIYNDHRSKFEGNSCSFV